MSIKRREKGPKKWREKMHAIATAKVVEDEAQKKAARIMQLSDRLAWVIREIISTDVKFHWEIPGEIEKLRRLKIERDQIQSELKHLGWI